jgi:hypothetical protein
LVRSATLGKVSTVCCSWFSRSRFAAALMCAALFDSRAALGATFEWSAPQACPTDADVRARVEAGLGVGLTALPDIAFEATVRQAEQAFVLELRARKGEATHVRRVRAKTCGELVDVLVAAMSLALESLGSQQGDEEPSPARDGSGEPETSAQLEPAGPSAPTPRKRAPPPGESTESPRLTGWVAAGALVDVGALPEPAPGAWLHLGAGWGVLQVRTRGLLIPKRRSALKGTTEGDFDLVAGGIGLCAASVRAPWEARVCLDGELGRLRGEGVQVRNPRKKSAVWLAAVPLVELLARPGVRGWAVSASVGLPVPLYRKSFVLTELGDVHTPASPDLRAAIGLELELW